MYWLFVLQVMIHYVVNIFTIHLYISMHLWKSNESWSGMKNINLRKVMSTQSFLTYMSSPRGLVLNSDKLFGRKSSQHDQTPIVGSWDIWFVQGYMQCQVEVWYAQNQWLMLSSHHSYDVWWAMLRNLLVFCSSTPYKLSDWWYFITHDSNLLLCWCLCGLLF